MTTTLNQGATLAAWINKDDVAGVSKLKGSIIISSGDYILRYLPTIYDAFALDCERFGVEFLIDVNDVEQDARDRNRDKPLMSMEDLRRLIGNEKQV